MSLGRAGARVDALPRHGVGVPVHEDRKHFEFLVLESAQAGLSWLTILRRPGRLPGRVRGFRPFTGGLLWRGRGGAVDGGWGHHPQPKENSRHYRQRQSFSRCSRGVRLLWRLPLGIHGGRTPLVNAWRTQDELPAVTPLSETLSKEMKRRGFTFLGPHGPLLPHAGRGAGQRPSGGVFSAPGGTRGMREGSNRGKYMLGIAIRRPVFLLFLVLLATGCAVKTPKEVAPPCRLR